jgi:hypothetical protein
VAHRNRYSQGAEELLKQVTQTVIAHIPAEILQDCTFRTPRNELFFSVHVGNLLIYRAPGYFDGDKRPTNDLLLIWPEGIRNTAIPEEDWREFYMEGGGFKMSVAST